MTTTEPVKAALTVDVDAALRRAHLRWGYDISNVDVEAAYLDRTLLATEVVRLREELAVTTEAQEEAEREVETLQTALLNIDDE